ncbi:MAG: sigma-54 dependent transcriptional regulator [Hyphomicrobiales bacterium]
MTIPLSDGRLRPSRVLLVEDSFALSETYQAYLKSEGYEITCVETGQAAMDIIAKDPPDVAVLDVHLPDMNGIEMLKELKSRDVPTDVIIITGQASVNLAVDAMREGAADFIMKPFTAERLRVTVRNAAERRNLEAKIEQIQEELHRDRFVSFVGRSPAMQMVYQTLQSASGSDATVFVRGESGTGKELCAEALHKLSSRKNGPHITLNCAAIPRDLLESEIFGHVKGAFTGATRDRKGAAMRANGGTLFLDEICEMDLSLQSKLLRFLQERTIQRVGDDVIHASDVRIVCATNRDPMAEVRAGRFREDLFYRLHVVPLILPPLRDRGDDVMLISEHFLQQFSEEDGKSFTGFDEEARQALMAYGWPGNVRQLQNIIRNIVVMNAGGLVSRAMLPVELSTLGQTAGPSAAHLNNPVPQQDIYGNVEPSVWPAHIAPTGLPSAGLPPADLLIPTLPQPVTPSYDHAAVQPAVNHFGTGNPVADQLIGNAYPAQEPIAEPTHHPMSQSTPPVEMPVASTAVAKTREDIKALDNVIRETIEEAIAICDGSVPKAARALDVSPSTLYRRLQSWAAADAKLRERNGDQAA